MKKIFTTLIIVLLTLGAFSQTPEKISYQSVIRSADNQLVTNQEIGIKISILQGSANGTAVYSETQSPTTNLNGLISIEIGSGTVVEGNFAEINWANNNYFIKTEIDPTGATNYTITGITPILSVPYALHSKTAETISGEFSETDPSLPDGNNVGDMLYWNGNEWVIIPIVQKEGATLQIVGGLPAWVAEEIDVSSVTNPTTGKTWMDRNLGASQVATSVSDEAAYGDLYQWGRATDGHEKRTSETTTTLSNSPTPGHGKFILSTSEPYDWCVTQNDDLWQGVNGINNPCPSGYRLPTNAEWEAELATWSSSNAAGAFASVLKLPLAGVRFNDNGAVELENFSGFYWSGTVYGIGAGTLTFNNNYSYVGNEERAGGQSVRCIKNY